MNGKDKTLTDLLQKNDINNTATISFKCQWYGCSYQIEYNPQNFLKKLTYTIGVPSIKINKI